MKCEICGRGPNQGMNLYRANELGVSGIWRCKDHHCAESFARAADPEISAIIESINGTKETRH